MQSSLEKLIHLRRRTLERARTNGRVVCASDAEAHHGFTTVVCTLLCQKAEKELVVKPSESIHGHGKRLLDVRFEATSVPYLCLHLRFT